MIKIEIGNKIEVCEFSSDDDLLEWCSENERYVDEVIQVDNDSELIWCKNIPYAISIYDVTKYDDEQYYYWGYDE